MEADNINLTVESSLRTQNSSDKKEMLDEPTNQENTDTILDTANRKPDVMSKIQNIDSDINKMEVDDILDVIEKKHLIDFSKNGSSDNEEKCDRAVTTMVQTILDSVHNEFIDEMEGPYKGDLKVGNKISDEHLSKDSNGLNLYSGENSFKEPAQSQTSLALPEKTILDACDVTKKVAHSLNANKCSDREMTVTVNGSQKVDGQTILDHANSNSTDSSCHFEVKYSEENKEVALQLDSLNTDIHVSTETGSPNIKEHMTCIEQINAQIMDSVIENAVKISELKSLSGQTNFVKTTKHDVYDIDNDNGDQFTHNTSDKKLKAFKETIDVHESREESAMTKDKNSDRDDNQTKLESERTSHFTNSSTEITKPVKREPGQINKRTVVYIYSKELIDVCDQMPKIPERASMVHSLIEAYGLTRYMRIVEPRRATNEEVTTFHDKEYVEFLQKMDDQDDAEKFENDATQYGLTYDCPLQQGIYNYAMMTTGATLVAAQCLLRETCQVAVNWNGGWHHAAKDHASGFCYINDIVVGILKLKEKYSKVLYVDFDLHHGDGVEDAFGATSKVMTVSFHKFAPGFFPGTGSLDDIGIGKGQYYNVNVPLLDGVRDPEFTPLVCRILNKVKEMFGPEVVVCQCGADGLAGDPMESFNLTHRGLGKCLYFLLQWNIPTLILGGGGYNLTNTARCWTYLTGIAVGKQLPVEIPDHQYFMEYGPDYDLEIEAGNRKNHNTAHYLRQVYGTVMSNISKIS